MVTDKEGNIYITGCTIIASSDYDFVTLKYNSNGDLQWVRTYDGPAGGHDKPVGLEIDDSNFIYVGGTSQDTSGNYNLDYFIIKYSSNGDTVWARRYNTFGGINNSDVAYAIASDKYNNFFITGYGGSSCLACPSGYLTVKFNSDGILQWTRIYKSTVNATDIPIHISTDKECNIYITGGTADGKTTTIKYSSNGDSLWVRKFDNSGFKVLPDSLFNVYVAGLVNNSSGRFEISLLKYDSNGVFQWHHSFNGNPGGQLSTTFFTDFCMDNEFIYIAGTSTAVQTPTDYLIIKVNSNGDTLWSKKYSYNSFSVDEAKSIVLDSLSNIYVTGRSERNSISYSIATVKYDSSGNQKWLIRYDNNIFALSSEAVKIRKDGKGNAIVLGQNQGNSSGWDIIVIKYSQLTAIQQLSNVIPKGFKLYQNYPNPFNSSTKIKYEIPLKSYIKIELFDETGKEILEMINEEHSHGEYEFKLNANNLASGIYFIRLISNEQLIDTKKLILLK
jgi:hypothetical protein